MLSQNVICPWCHHLMYPIQQVVEDGMIRRGQEQLRNYYYECECGAQSSEIYGVYTHEEAENALLDLLNVDVLHLNNEYHTYLMLYMAQQKNLKISTDTFTTCSTGAQLIEDAKTYLKNKLGNDNFAVWNICKLD